MTSTFGIPNNAGMSPSEIIDLLGGTSATARKARVRPSSVSDWRRNGVPEDKLIMLAAELEALSGGRFSRRGHWPADWQRIWPELAVREPLPA